VDPVNDLIPIKPAAHYTMGGIAVNKNLESSIKGLFAVGECSEAMIHGGNRLGGNSLLELIVFAKEAVENALLFAKQRGDFKPLNKEQQQKDENFKETLYRLSNQIDFYEKREMIGKILYQNCGVFREDINLKAALSYIRQTQKELPFMGIGDKSRVYNSNFVEFVEFGNMLELAEALLVAAISRRESRGAHYRIDFPTSHESYKARSIIWKKDGVICGDFIKVGDEV
jgi:succinate dehydrogenase / fumarate reductase flavoprotein subunit